MSGASGSSASASRRGVLGSLLVIVATGPAALPVLLAGRTVQGVSAALIMPASLAIVKAYWHDRDRQRAVSLWSIGSSGGAGTSALFGGAMTSAFGWRSIFIVSIVASVIAFLLVFRTPETRATHVRRGFDLVGMVIFMVAVLGMMIVLIFGATFGWTTSTSGRRGWSS